MGDRVEGGSVMCGRTGGRLCTDRLLMVSSGEGVGGARGDVIGVDLEVGCRPRDTDLESLLLEDPVGADPVGADPVGADPVGADPVADLESLVFVPGYNTSTEQEAPTQIWKPRPDIPHPFRMSARPKHGKPYSKVASCYSGPNMASCYSGPNMASEAPVRHSPSHCSKRNLNLDAYYHPKSRPPASNPNPCPTPQPQLRRNANPFTASPFPPFSRHTPKRPHTSPSHPSLSRLPLIPPSHPSLTAYPLIPPSTAHPLIPPSHPSLTPLLLTLSDPPHPTTNLPLIPNLRRYPYLDRCSLSRQCRPPISLSSFRGPEARFSPTLRPSAPALLPRWHPTCSLF